MLIRDRRRGTAARLATATTIALSSAGLLAAGAALGAGSGGVGTGESGAGGESSDGVAAGESSDGVFPVRGKHTYGDGLGAGRDHQGQDLLAKCGKPVVAAQPGRIQLAEFDGSAGNYVVIDGAGKRKDTVYMHLLRRPSVRKTERVAAGDLIGRVGSTGNSSACHLHFEMWSGAGYYEGGKPIDPEPHLRRWDRAT
jgi:murein DD-endopeptidase MepM/ murein hydrolase activator NlpD